MTVDVRDMVCAQALAVVAKALAGLPARSTTTILVNADDVRRDLLAWAADRGYTVATARPGSNDRRAGEAGGAIQVMT